MAQQTTERWTAEYAQQVLLERERSGLTIEAFARGKGWNGSRLRWWHKHLAVGAAVPALLPVRVVVDAQPQAVLEVELCSGHVLRLVNVTLDGVQALVSALEGTC